MNIGNFIQNIQDSINSGVIEGMTHLDKMMLGNEFAIGAIVASVSAGSLYLMRSLPSKLYNFLVKHLTTTIDFNNTHESYYQLWRFLNERGIIKQSRFIKVSNGKYGEDKNLTKEMGYGSQIFWLNWYTPLIIASSKEESSVSHQVKEFLKITKLGRSHKFFDQLMGALSDTGKTKDMIDYWTFDDGYKQYACRQPKRSFDSIAIPENTKEYLLNGIDHFISQEQWYIDHGVPYQLGILLYGPPGTGKSSIVKAIAGYMNTDIVLVTSPKELAEASQQVSDAIIVAEEIDTFGLANRDKKESSKKDDKNSSNSSLSAVLNSLDGVISNHGRIVILTTNHPDTLDKALIRPGRIDLHVSVEYLTNETFEFLLNRFFDDVQLPNDYLISNNVSPVQIQNDIMTGLSCEKLLEKYQQKINIEDIT